MPMGLSKTHQALVQDNSCDPGFETGVSAERLEISERRKISRLNSIQELFLRWQYPARHSEGVRIMATKQFGYRVFVSVSSTADQLRFRCFVQRVRRASHIELCCAGRFRDEHVAFQRGPEKVNANRLRCAAATKVGAHFPGLAPVYWHPGVDGGDSLYCYAVVPDARGQH
jgi:hypothetical protein